MERQFNRRFGAKPRDFSVGDKVFARHRISQSWRPGGVIKRTGVIYDVKFSDGSSSRYHANQLRERHTADQGEDHLAVIHQTFGLPPPPQFVNEPAVDEHPDEPEAEQPEPAQVPEPEFEPEEQAGTADEQEEQGNSLIAGRYPNRNRHPPNRFEVDAQGVRNRRRP
jgi:hypothetical protein